MALAWRVPTRCSCGGLGRRGRGGKGRSAVKALQDGAQKSEQEEESGAATIGDAPIPAPDADKQRRTVQSFLNPDPEELPDGAMVLSSAFSPRCRAPPLDLPLCAEVEMSIWDHLEELRERVLRGAGVCGVGVLGCFVYSKQLVVLLEQPVSQMGVRFLQLAPGEYFFTTVKVAGYSGLLLGAPWVLYEAIAYVVPGLTRSERRFLAPIVLGSSVLFYAGVAFSYWALVPAALKFFISYSEGAVESLWSIDSYFEFILALMLSTGLSFQVPIVQALLGQAGLVSSTQMLSIWRYVVVGAAAAAAVLTPSTDPFTQSLLAAPLIGLYLGGAAFTRFVEIARQQPP